MTIAILCPTRGREAQFDRMRKSMKATCSESVIVYSGTNGNDNYARAIFPIDCPTSYMWNKLAEEAMKDKDITHFMLGADDMIFSTPLWDEAIMKLYDHKPHVYHLQDSRDKDGTPHPIVTREYIEAMGYFLPPIFMHWYVDSWTVEIAKYNKCFTHLRDYLLVHDKPSDKGQADETHNRIRRNGWKERDDYVNKTCQHFLALEKSRLHMAMSSPARQYEAILRDNEEVLKGISVR